MKIVKGREEPNLKKSPVNSTRRSARSNGQCALNVVLIVMVVVSLIIAVSAFLSIQKSNHRINTVVAEASDFLQSSSAAPEIERVGKCFIDRLEAIGKYSMEASTVSFLVTILSAGVISLGVYLADRGYRSLRDLENKARDLDAKLLQASTKADEMARLMAAESKAITERAAITGTISSLVVRSYQISLLLKESSTVILLPPQKQPKLQQ